VAHLAGRLPSVGGGTRDSGFGKRDTGIGGGSRSAPAMCWDSGFRNQGGVRGEVEVRFLLSLLIEARMLFKINGVTRDLRRFSDPTRFLITLNLKKLSNGCEREAKYAFIPYVRSPNVIENNEA